MKKVLITISAATLLFACSNAEPKEEVTVNNEVNENTVEVETSTEYGKKNYAVVWNWTAEDKTLIDASIIAQSEQLTSLWKRGIVQDIYYDADANHDKLEYYPNISFFLRAKSVDDAKSILNDMVMVKEHIALYTIFEVGTKWLGRKAKVIGKNGMQESYVAIWNTVTKHDDQNIVNKLEDNKKAQSDAVIALWENGEVENIYFDIKGINKLDPITDFVIFVNAESIDAAREKMENLPFAQKQIASFQLFPVGIFWMGEYNKH